MNNRTYKKKRHLTLRFDDKRNNAPEHQNQIAELNQRLVWWGVLDEQYAKDTNFSTKTLDAVITFQNKRQLVADGIVGVNTWYELLKSSSEQVKPEEVVEIYNQCTEHGCSIEPQEHEKLDAGIELIKYWEGLRLTTYICPAGQKTIGYGSTRTLDGKPWVVGQKITKQLAENLLRVQIKEEFLPKLHKLPYWWGMNNNQRSALLSFAYNLGANFYGSDGFETITRNLKNQEWSSIPKTLMLYVNPGSKFEKGLRNRRQQEGQLWSKVA